MSAFPALDVLFESFASRTFPSREFLVAAAVPCSRSFLPAHRHEPKGTLPRYGIPQKGRFLRNGSAEAAPPGKQPSHLRQQVQQSYTPPPPPVHGVAFACLPSPFSFAQDERATEVSSITMGRCFGQLRLWPAHAQGEIP